MIPPYYLTIACFVCINILLALSIGVLSGYAGQVSLGHAAFMAIGAYTSALLTTKFGMNVWAAMPLSAVMAGIVGIFLGLISLRLKEDFLAITTMGLNFIVIGIFLYAPYFGKALGMGSIPVPRLFGEELGRLGYTGICILIVLIVIASVWWLQRSWIGMAWRGVRDAQHVAQVMGVNIARFKIIAFVFSTAIAGLAGSLYAHFLLFITPYDFGFPVSIQILTLAVFGGLGTIRGPVLGAIILTLVPEYLRFIQDYRMLCYGLLLVLIMMFQPQGLFGKKSFIVERIKALKTKT
jgi:branched-chain amino acid transport system permease protein